MSGVVTLNKRCPYDVRGWFDYLAGMTDNYAIDLHRQAFSMESML